MDKLIIWLAVISLFSQASFSLLAPFYPTVAEDQKGLTATAVGMVFTAYSIAFVITSLIMGMILGKIGRRL